MGQLELPIPGGLSVFVTIRVAEGVAQNAPQTSKSCQIFVTPRNYDLFVLACPPTPGYSFSTVGVVDKAKQFSHCPQ